MVEKVGAFEGPTAQLVVDTISKGRNRFFRAIGITAALTITTLATLLSQEPALAANSTLSNTGLERCPSLHVKGHPNISLRNAAIDVVIETFSDQPIGKAAFMTDPMYRNNLAEQMTTVKNFAWDSMGMNLVINPYKIVQMPRKFNPTYSGKGGQDALMNDSPKASPPRNTTSALRVATVYYYAANPLEDVNDSYPNPGSTTDMRVDRTYSIISMNYLADDASETGKWLLAHEVLMHGLANQDLHENQRQKESDPNSPLINPKFNPLSILMSFLSNNRPFKYATLTDFNLKGICRGIPLPDLLPGRQRTLLPVNLKS